MKSNKEVNTYIANAVKEARPIMKELQDIIRSAIPNAEEAIAWNVPIYKHHGVLAGFSVAKKHVSFGVDTLPDSDRKELEEKGYKTGSKTIQIRFDQKVPHTVIKKLLKAQAKINESKSKDQK